MQVSQDTLRKAVEANIIQSNQVEPLIEFIKKQYENNPRLTMTHVFYYLGGLLAIGAMTLFMTLGWAHFGGAGIAGLSAAYMFLGLLLTRYFHERGHFIPAGIMATFVIALTPLFVYGLQVALGIWPNKMHYRDYHRFINWSWTYMELATLLVGALFLYRYRYPFMLMPIAFTLWYLSMDLAPFFAHDWVSYYKACKHISIVFGILTIGLAFYIDLRNKSTADYSFWLYLVGVIMFWCGLSLLKSNSEISKFIYFSINLAMIFVGTILYRRVFLVFGTLGVMGYIGYLSVKYFKNSALFPVWLTFLGISIIYLGIVWQRHEKSFLSFIKPKLPQSFQDMLERREL